MALRLVYSGQDHRVASGDSGGLLSNITPKTTHLEERQNEIVRRWCQCEKISRVLRHDINNLPHAGRLFVHDFATGLLETLRECLDSLDFVALRRYDSHRDQIEAGIRESGLRVAPPGHGVRWFMDQQSPALAGFSRAQALQLCKSRLDLRMVVMREFWRDQKRRACTTYKIEIDVRDRALSLVNDVVMSTLRRWDKEGNANQHHLRIVK